MTEEARVGWVRRGATFAAAAVTENLGVKALALLLALIVFIVTRDEVTRSFTVPLRVIDDPQRVLLTEPPEVVEVQLRGPWANVNRLSETEVGSATLDLREVRPGPMELDPAAIVMPPGVVLDKLIYDPVDLRFEAVIERALEVTPVLVGEVDADHRLVGARVEPDHWTVRAPASEFARAAPLQTETIDIGGIAKDVEMQVELEPAPVELTLLGVRAGERPSVRLIVEVEPLPGEVELEVATAEVLREASPKLAASELPEFERVTVRGPRVLLRALEQLEAPLVPQVEIEASGGRGAPILVTLRFDWSPDVPQAAVEQLTITPTLIRLRLSPTGTELDTADTD